MQDEYNKGNWENEQDNERGSSLSRLDFFKSTSQKSIKSGTLLRALPFVVAGSILAFVIVFTWINLSKLDKKIKVLEDEIQQIDSLYKRDSTEYHDLKSTPSLIEHIAREDYYMKSEGEEIYVIKKANQGDNNE